MAVDPYLRPRQTPDVAVSLAWGGRARTLRIGRSAALAVFIVLPLLAVWYLGATAYFVFHDQLLASLISRETEAQYAYEDRIAGLKNEIDRQTSRALVDRQTLTTTIGELEARSARLETRAAAVDALVSGIDTNRDPSSGAAGLVDRPTPAPRGERNRSDGRSEDHVEIAPGIAGTRIAAVLDAVEVRQSAQVERLRDPLVRSVGRLRTALADTGLPLSRWHVEPDIGGPFVPLPEASRAASFEQNLAALQDAVVQHAKLTGIIDGVPLRRPLAGHAEITSPFGARLDPFFGRPAMHTGLDLMQAYGSPVLATASGTVTVAGPSGGYGNMVEIDHGHGLVTRYGHLSEVDVAVNQKVATGDIVGHIGSTGRATGPHLHYETRINGEPVDPTRFLQAGHALEGDAL